MKSYPSVILGQGDHRRLWPPRKADTINNRRGRIVGIVWGLALIALIGLILATR